MATRTGMPDWRNNRWEARTRSQSSPALCCLPVFTLPPYPPLFFTCSHSAADTEDKHLRCLYTGSNSSLLVTLFTLAETNRAGSAGSVAWTNSSARAVQTSVKRGSGIGQGDGFVHGWMYQLSRSCCGCPHGCWPCRRALFTLAASVAVVFMPSAPPVTKARTEGNNTPSALQYRTVSPVKYYLSIISQAVCTVPALRGLAQTLITYVTGACTTERSRSPSSTSICSILSRWRHKIRE